MSRKLIRILAALAIILLLLVGNASPTQAQAGDPYSLIDAVNNLRIGNGLPAYSINSILMGIAQAHSDYQASIGSVTHTGAGGTNPRARAAGAGYGGGATFFISENIAGGTDLSVDGAISMWLGDDPHIQTMLGANYRDIGAGVAVANGFVYYTIDVAYVAGSGNYVPPPTITPGGPTPLPVYYVFTATPSMDGSVVHEVMPGQTLITIAAAYGVTVNDIKTLNHLTSDRIYIGDKLIIRIANTPGPTGTETTTSTPTRAATATRKPTRTPTPSSSPPVTPEATILAASTMKDAAPPGSDATGSLLVIAIIVLAVGGVIMMVVGGMLRRNPDRPPG